MFVTALRNGQKISLLTSLTEDFDSGGIIYFNVYNFVPIRSAQT